MIHYAVAFALLLHVLFWGAGLAMVAMPRAWRRFWPVLVAPAGAALQSLVVWLAAYAGARGTNAYAYSSEIVPVVFLLLAFRRGGWRAAWVDLQRIGVVAAATGGCLALLVAPYAWASRGLTTISLASCDAADYAAGARTLMEFARAERGGFLGLTEVVHTLSVDNFFDYWLRLNHFTPSALIALNGSVLRCAPHELTGLVMMVLLAATVPVAFWIARAVVGYNGVASVWLAALFGLSPVMWYAAGHVAIGQVLAAQGIALLTWAGVALWRRVGAIRVGRRRCSESRGTEFGWVLMIGYALVLGSYNFIIVVALAPAVGYVGGRALWRGEWGRFGYWAWGMLMPLAVIGMIFFARVAGLVERFRLFNTFDFGWRIPVLTPEGWLGLVSGPELRAWEFLGVRWWLAAAVVALLAWAFARAARARRSAAWVAAGLALPVLAGYALLEWRAVRLGTNGSYNAYKLFTVFYPVTLPAFCWWLTLRRSWRLAEWVFVVGVAAFVTAGSLVGDAMFLWRMSQAPFVVDGELRQLRKIEAMPDVKSVNVLLPDMWSRLWANEFLLRKPQYFSTDTYEARWHTPLRGEWDLTGGLVAVRLPGDAWRPIARQVALLDTRSPQFLRADLGDGWHAEEQAPKTNERWRWTKGEATLRIENPQARALTVTCTVDGWSFGERDLILVDATGAATPAQHLGGQRTKTRFASIAVPPGGSTLTLRSVQPATVPPGDTRAIAVCVFGIDLDVSAR